MIENDARVSRLHILRSCARARFKKQTNTQHMSLRCLFVVRDAELLCFKRFASVDDEALRRQLAAIPDDRDAFALDCAQLVNVVDQCSVQSTGPTALTLGAGERQSDDGLGPVVFVKNVRPRCLHSASCDCGLKLDSRMLWESWRLQCRYCILINQG
jgi:hypothetical protein